MARTLAFLSLLAVSGCFGGGFGMMDPGNNCTRGSACTCSITGNCLKTCTGGGCNFVCSGTGNCENTCEGGGCTQQCSGTGNCVLDCPGGGCSILCSGGITDNCICATGCSADGGTSG